jgi:hypothetical protein
MAYTLKDDDDDDDDEFIKNQLLDVKNTHQRAAFRVVRMADQTNGLYQHYKAGIKLFLCLILSSTS